MHPTKGLTRRGPVVFAVAAAVAAATVAGPSNAAAQESGPARTSAPGPASTPAVAQPADSAIDLTGVGAGPHTVTLVTGDKVTLTPVAGRFDVRVQQAPRQGHSSPGILRQSTPDGLYVLPADALAAVEAGRLDRELFNVTYLVEHGYTDEQTGTVPVIVQYPKARASASVMSAADALPASTPTVRLESLHGAALHVAKKQAGQFWASIQGRQAGAGGQFTPNAVLGSGVSRVWLDRKVEVNLAESVPLIGAPQAWAAGYDGTGVKVAVLDTGIDENHPDLAGKVVASKSFVPDVPTVHDGHGHGTHVASTIAGSGAASGGKYKGVAPGAELVVGKVLTDAGSGEDSWIIDAMEWAATSGAKVVSMSLGTDGASDGTDPMSQAVNDLTARTGTLFVIAAGNAGSASETISAPGAAEAALTVAATDKTDRLAGFSSRGPRLDGGLKPDLAAPGVNIIAARAAGTVLDPFQIVDDYYAGASGTSMATPHVAAAAAILAQQHPDWAGPRLKAALMSTAKDVGYDAYEVGAGRLDVAHATTTQVVATTPNADFGTIVPEDTPAPASRQVSYANLSDRDVTLTLTAALHPTRGTGDDTGLTVDPTLTVPAHGTATATLTLDPSGLALGTHTGAVTATADGVSLTTPVAAARQAPTVDLRVRTLGFDGKPVNPFAQATIDVTGAKGDLHGVRLVEEGVTVVRVPEGKVSVLQLVDWVDEDSLVNVAYLVNPEVDVTGDTEITLDLRTASQVSFDTPTPAEPINNWFDAYYLRTTASGDKYLQSFVYGEPIGAWAKVWATSTRAVTVGKARFATQWTLGKSEVDLSVVRPHRQALHSIAPHHWEQTGTGTPDYLGFPDFRFFEPTQDLELAYAGVGDPEDLAGRDLRGKLLLVTSDDIVIHVERIQALRETGAAGIVFFPPDGGFVPMEFVQEPLSGPAKPIGIPFTFVSNREGEALRDRLATESLTLRVTTTRETPYTYVLKPYEEGRIPESLHYRLGQHDLAKVDLDIHAPERTAMMEAHVVWKQDDELAVSGVTFMAMNGRAYHAPRTRTEWVGPLYPDVLHSRHITSMGPDGNGPAATRQATTIYDSPVRLREQWFAGPITPGARTMTDERAYTLPDAGDFASSQAGLRSICTMCRQGENFWPFLNMTTGSTGNRFDDNMQGTWQFTYRLDKDGVPVPEQFPGTVLRRFLVDDQPGTYHLTATSPASAQNPQTEARWTWKAGPVDPDNWQPGYGCLSAAFGISTDPCHPEPLVYVSYDLTDSLAMDNTVPAGQPHRFTVDAYHSPSRMAMPAIAGLKLWASTDDGRTWTPVRVTRNRQGTFTATATYPAYDRTTGAVSLKVEAWDTDGNRVEQTTMRAVTLRAGRAGGAHRAE